MQHQWRPRPQPNISDPGPGKIPTPVGLYPPALQCSGVTSCHYRGMNAKSGKSPLSSHSQGNAAQVMLLTKPLVCPETSQQTDQKQFRGEINNQPLGVTYSSCSQHQAMGAWVSLLREIKDTKRYGKYGKESIVSMGMRNTGTEGVQEVWGKDQSTRQPTFVCRRTAIHHPHHRPGINPPSLPTQHPPTRSTKQFSTHPKPHTTKEAPLALEVELTCSAASYRTTSRQQRFWLVF